MSSCYEGSGQYKPTLDQLPLTRLLDFDLLRERQIPCFGTLERALVFLAQNIGTAATYPPPRTAT